MIAGNIKIEDIPNLNYEEFFIDLSGSLENNEGNKDLNKINKLLSLAEKI
jgi:phosphoribosylanthranilate isomerase